MAQQKLTAKQIRALATLFPPGAQAEALLNSAEFPVWLLPPPAGLNGFQFWTQVSGQLEGGVMPDGVRAVLAAAKQVYPYNPDFELEGADSPDVPAARAASAASAGTASAPVFTRAAPLRVLVVGASPAGVPPVRADRESSRIQQAAQPDHIDVTYVPAAQATDLEKVRSVRPDVVHFVCHGDGGCLVFNDVQGESDPVKASRIADTLSFYRSSADIRLRAVVLAACDGDTLASAFTAVADTVIAFRGKLSDPCGTAFAGQFYKLLNETDGIAAAAREAAQLTAAFSGDCAPVIDSLIVLPESAA